MYKAVNCNDSCESFDICHAEGMTSMFLLGAVCSDRCEKDEPDGQEEDCGDTRLDRLDAAFE